MVMDRVSNQVLTGAMAPTVGKFDFWLRKHPNYEPVLPKSTIFIHFFLRFSPFFELLRVFDLRILILHCLIFGQGSKVKV